MDINQQLRYLDDLYARIERGESVITEVSEERDFSSSSKNISLRITDKFKLNPTHQHTVYPYVVSTGTTSSSTSAYITGVYS